MTTPRKRTFVIGDVQGCLAPLKALLNKINYDPQDTQIWFTGDLINRGPQSLETLRFIMSLPQDTVCVLGNHDLSLMVAEQGLYIPKPQDTYAEILTAPDKAQLIEWLRHRPLLHHDPQQQWVVTHAGIYPKWDLPTAILRAREVEALLRGVDFPHLINNMFGNTPNAWDDQLTGWDRARFIINAFTRMRFCTANGELELYSTGTPAQHPSLIPWYDLPNRVNISAGLIFGHWAALSGKCHVANIYPIDTGCVWGHCLTAFCLESKQYVTMDCSHDLG
jgi:bis(5'-nucleosyl)-tetraphosphatase (symmetrical)